MDDHEISASESYSFRRMRIVWLLLFGLTALAFLIAPHSLWPLFIFALCFNLGFYVIFWPCPRCGRFYSLRFGLISTVWPYSNSCLHCGSKLSNAQSSDAAGT